MQKLNFSSKNKHLSPFVNAFRREKVATNSRKKRKPAKNYTDKAREMNHRLSKKIVIDLHHVNIKFGGANDVKKSVDWKFIAMGHDQCEIYRENEFFIWQ